MPWAVAVVTKRAKDANEDERILNECRATAKLPNDDYNKYKEKKRQ